MHHRKRNVVNFSSLSLQVNSQLMEAIQQKVELSQQLEQWKGDMEALLEDQIRERLVDAEKETRLRAMKTENDTNKGFFSFFHRS